ncbi:MAG: hypothetical protein K9M17_00685 [Mariprofundaceae bacterium]|nr:hypothetical protein [Mariprofundaceae bacterium]
MKYSPRFLIFVIALLGLSACADRPLLIPWEDPKDQPDYARGSAGSSKADSRAPLDVPPSLMGEVEVPTPDSVASRRGELPEYAKEAVAGKAVALDAKLYAVDAAKVFSAVIDAMTSLNLPVQSVDSPSGTVTTDWIRWDAGSATSTQASFGGLFGGDGVQGYRHRFVIRVLRQKVEGESGAQTRLEIRTIGQGYINRHWVNRPFKRNVSGELFSAVDERFQAGGL